MDTKRTHQRRALVCGAGGFIGGHLVTRLKREGYWVRGVDIKRHEWGSVADEFLVRDLREPENCFDLLMSGFDEVYQLAADMGGMGFISFNEADILYNNALINLHMTREAATFKVQRYFFSSSVCVYRDMVIGEPPMREEQAIPAHPDNEYGWEKLYSERVALAHGRKAGMRVRIARFQNCYGPEGTWRGGREKAPAALCRKVSEAQDGGAIDVWGDGSAVRSYIYVDDLVDGIYRLMHSEIETPVNIGRNEYVSVDELAQTIIEISGKRLSINHIDGPVGVQSRNFSHERMESLGWYADTALRDGLTKTYQWVARQVEQQAELA